MARMMIDTCEYNGYKLISYRARPYPCELDWNDNNIKGLNNWEEYYVPNKKVKGLKITAIPAQHTNIKRLDKLMGKVIGFTIEWEEQQNGCIYISGDTVLFEGIYELAKKKKVDIAILHLGAGAFPYLKKNLRLTMNGEEAIETTKILHNILKIEFSKYHTMCSK